MQQLSVKAKARRLTHAQKLREAGCKAMARMPKFSGEGTFRTFRLEYAMWLKVNRIEEIPDETRPDQTRPDQTRPDQTR